MTNSDLIYNEMFKFIGVAEVPGPKSNPLISNWIKLAATWLDRDDSSTPWCGCLRGAVGLTTATGVPPEHYRAKNWLRWGAPVGTIRDAVKGDTVVLVRKGGFHVALFDHLISDKVFLLGGNQSNKVSIAPFSTTDIEGIRR